MLKKKYSQPTKKYYGKNIYDSFSFKVQFSFRLTISHFYSIFFLARQFQMVSSLSQIFVEIERGIQKLFQ